MGYCISVDCDNFSFDNYKADEVLVAIKNGIIDAKITEERWIDFNVLLKAETVEEAFEELRFELYEKDNKYKIDYFSGEKLAGWELEVFQCIAPYIDDGYLEYIGEDGEQWRYIFKNGECREVYPSITYDIVSYDTDTWDLEIALNKLGIPIKTSDGEFRSLEDVLNDLSSLWEEYVESK